LKGHLRHPATRVERLFDSGGRTPGAAAVTRKARVVLVGMIARRSLPGV